MVKFNLRGEWMVLLAAMLWGTTGTAQTFAPNGATPEAVGALRLLIGGVTLLLLAFSKQAFHQGGRWNRIALLVGGVGVAAYQVCFFAAVDRTGVAVGTIVGIGSAPIMTGVLDYLLRGDVVDRRWMAATSLAVFGCVLLVASGGEIGVDLLGVLLALGAGLSYSIYTIASKYALETQPPDAVMAVIFCLGAVFLLPLLVLADLRWLAQPSGILVGLHLGVMTTGVAYALFGRGLQLILPRTAVTLSLAEPLTAAVLGVFIVGENLNTVALIGIALLFGGLYLLTVTNRSKAIKISPNPL